MDFETKKLYERAFNDQEFNAEMLASNKKIGRLLSDREKYIYTGMYYGWCIGKFGVKKAADKLSV